MTCCVTSRTYATVPTDRTRTTIGVGEKVRLTFSPGSAKWTTDNGTLSATGGSSTTLTAPDRAASVTVTATGDDGCTAPLTFTVIEPSDVKMERSGSVWHKQGIPSVGMKTDIYILPANVSFENIQVIEGDATGVVTGYFVGSPYDGVHHSGHGAGVWGTVGPVTEGKGSKLGAHDNVKSGYCNFGVPYTAGTFDWPIPWSFHVDPGDAKEFRTVTHHMDIDASGNMSISKAGASASAALNDPDSSD